MGALKRKFALNLLNNVFMCFIHNNILVYGWAGVPSPVDTSRHSAMVHCEPLSWLLRYTHWVQGCVQRKLDFLLHFMLFPFLVSYIAAQSHNRRSTRNPAYQLSGFVFCGWIVNKVMWLYSVPYCWKSLRMV